jgi:hypothetical protein
VKENNKTYVYREKENTYEEASNLQISFYEEPKKYGARDYEIDNYKAW